MLALQPVIQSFWASDGGLILVRELDERLGFGDLIAQHLTDSRHGKNTQLPLADLLRQSVYSRIAGCRAALARPTFRLIGSEKTWDAPERLVWGVRC